MTVDHRERSFEKAIVDALTATGGTISYEAPGPEASYLPGGYYLRQPEEYDRARCLISVSYTHLDVYKRQGLS